MSFFQDVLLRLGIKGDRKVVKGLEGVSKAKKKLTDQEAKASKAAKVGTENQESLNAAMGDYAGALSAVNPQLGAVAAASEQLFKIGGDLGKLPLGELLGKTTSKLKEFSGALKFVGAAGLAAASIALLVKTYKDLNAEAERYIENLSKQQIAQDKLAGKQQSIEDAFRDAANARRGMAPVSREQARGEAGSIQALADRLGIDPVEVARLKGQTRGAGFSEQEFIQLLAVQETGRGIPFATDMDLASRRAAGRAAIEKAPQITSEAGLKTIFGDPRGTAKRATEGGAQAGANMRLRIKAVLPGISDEDVEDIMEIQRRQGGLSPRSNVRRDARNEAIKRATGREGTVERFVPDETGRTKEFEEEDIRNTEIVAQAIRQEKRQDEERRAGQGPEQAPIVQYNGTYNFNTGGNGASVQDDVADTEGSQ